jgi:monoterpene epsilon-lactone hydrolase
MWTCEDDRLLTRLLSALPPRRSGIAASPELQALRTWADESMRAAPHTPDIAVETRNIGGIACTICTPPDVTGTLLHVHGGGFRLGSAAAWTAFGTRLATAAGVEVVLPDYGLSPEHPYPNALHDLAQVYAVLADRHGHASLLMGGDSAGGALAASIALAAAHAEAPPAGLILLSPWLDLRVCSPTFDSRAATDSLFPRAAAESAADLYLQGANPAEGTASPRFNELAKAPPTLLAVSSTETLLQDSLDMASALALAGRPVNLHVFAGEIHDWPVLALDTPAAAQAIALVGSFARSVGA